MPLLLRLSGSSGHLALVSSASRSRIRIIILSLECLPRLSHLSSGVQCPLRPLAPFLPFVSKAVQKKKPALSSWRIGSWGGRTTGQHNRACRDKKSRTIGRSSRTWIWKSLLLQGEASMTCSFVKAFVGNYVPSISVFMIRGLKVAIGGWEGSEEGEYDQLW